MTLTVYWIEPSPPARSVALVVAALDLRVEYKTVDLREKEQFTPEFLMLNPLHTVPVIDDDGFVLWESRAIMTYLVSKYAKDDSLYPKDLRKRAIVDQRLHYSNDVFFVIRDIAKSLIFFNASKISEEQLQKVKDAQDNIEKLLQGQSFMAGDDLTLADMIFITMVDVLEVYNSSWDKNSLTKGWFERCKSIITDFDNVNKTGADQLTAVLKEKLEKSQV